MFKEQDVAHYIKISHLIWTGYVICTNNSNRLKEIFSARPCNTRRDRPRLRLIHVVEKDCLVFKIKNWRSLAADRGGWNRLVQNTLAHIEPQ
ncbi:hypothetical protein TNCT_686221 [Trichonephila clavata]|uniref:Uncharacterized protein n=1 Tax=Trichonephila clavata TaxID=2740835 RepID=A0A8X6LEC7_TRICU|nr:hypothetical protein TNCT_686221 [Trichonephila clavata]